MASRLVSRLRAALSPRGAPKKPIFNKLHNISRASNWPPHHEWLLEDAHCRTRFSTLRPQAVRLQRLWSGMWPHLFDFSNVVLVGGTTVLLYGLACVEGWLVSSDDNRSWRFVGVYALHQMLISAVWGTQDERLVCLSLGLDPDTHLHHFEDTPHDAITQLTIHDLRATRGILAGYMFMAQILRMVNHTLAAGKRFRARVLGGKEPPLPSGVQGRVLRLCGQKSLVTELSVRRYGQHVFPVLEAMSEESPRRRSVERVVMTWSQNGRRPAHWQVDRSMYGLASTYSDLGLETHFCLHTTTGGRILCVEADATNSEDSLGLGTDPQDLTHTHALLAFRTVARLARERMDGDVRLLRVYLGDLLMQVRSGGGSSRSVRGIIIRHTDILIDSHAAVLKPLLDWCRGVHLGFGAVTDGPTVFRFRTDSKLYFHNLAAILAQHRWGLVDSGNHQGTIVYFSNCDLTVNAVHNMVDSSGDQDDMRNVAVVVDSVEAFEELQELKTCANKRFELICAAHVHDDLLRQVRVWARLGYGNEEIQTEIDHRLQKVTLVRAKAMDVLGSAVARAR